MTDFTPTNLRSRFAELTQQREDIIAASGPLREQRDALVQQASQQIQALDADIKTAEAGLAEIDQERAMIARALGGKTGE